jgi:hypothetical protein
VPLVACRLSSAAAPCQVRYVPPMPWPEASLIGLCAATLNHCLPILIRL